MPHYFIDTDDGRMEVTDDEGHELTDPMAARDLALRALSDMTRGALAESDRRTFSARVRASDGTPLYGANLTLSGEWWIEPPTA